MPNKTTERRAKESWRARACAAGVSVGAQVYLFATGVAMPIALSSAWIAALAALPMAALITAVCRRALVLPKRGGAWTCALHALLALTLLANAVFSAASLVNFAEQTLLEQTRAAWSAALAAAAIFLSALSGGTGVSRLCFSLRFFLPALATALTVASVPLRTPVGLFPLLGAGALPLGVSALCMLGAATPALMLLLPPPELAISGEAAQRSPVPDARFFLVRVLAGAGVGALLAFAACAFSTYESISENAEWGARLHIVASYQPREGIAQMLLTLTQAIAMMLLAVSMLAAAEQALVRAAPCMARRRAGLIVSALALTLCLAALMIFGFDIALFAAPLVSVPAVILMIFHKRLGALPA